MSSGYWLKLYHEMLDDPKVARLPDSSYRRFVECLLLAGETNEDGFLPDMPDMAWRLRLGEGVLSADLSRLALAGLVELRIDPDGVERWFVCQFAERQAPVSGAERVRRHRERQQGTRPQSDHVTKRYTTRNERVTNVVTDIDKDIDKDTDADADADRVRAHARGHNNGNNGSAALMPPEWYEMPKERAGTLAHRDEALSDAATLALVEAWEKIVAIRRPRHAETFRTRWYEPLRLLVGQFGGDVTAAAAALAAARNGMIAEGKTPKWPDAVTYRVRQPGAVAEAVPAESVARRNARLALEAHNREQMAR